MFHPSHLYLPYTSPPGYTHPVVQALALCLEDPIQFRTQWPTVPMLKVADKPLRVVNRMASVQAGPMQVNGGGGQWWWR